MSLELAVRRQLLATAVPISKAIGHVHAPWTHKRITGLHYHAALARFEKGDVLNSRTAGELTNLFIPGFWSHGAIYVGDGEVVEAIGEGVVLTDLVTWMLTKDYVRALEPLFTSSIGQRIDAAAWARAQVGKREYDYGFNPDEEKLYCFELTYAAYRHACGIETPWKLRTETMGVPTVVGDDFDRSRKWRTVWDSREWRATRVGGCGVLVPAGALACA